MDDNNTTYQESLDWLFSQLPMFSRIGAAAYKPGLDTSLRLDEWFGHPHKKYKSVHIAGTNGKGSTSHMLASILQEAGYKTGLYTSPHLVDFRERMRVNGRMIDKESVVSFIRKWKAGNYEGKPSFFELTMMMAFDWFAKEGVEIAVIETGMGGRLDSTNIISPIGCVITNISADHMQFLGDTLEKITTEKAGIIKPGIPVVIGSTKSDNESPRIREVFHKRAEDGKSEIIFADENPLFTPLDSNNGMSLSGEAGELGKIISPLAGDYQIENINTVLHSVMMLRQRGLVISDENIREGISNVIGNTGLMGRWMQIGERPLQICDTGHNEAGIRSIFGKLMRIWDRKKTDGENSSLRIVLGFVNDKDVEHIVPLLPRDAEYYVTRASVPRAMPAERLIEIMERNGFNVRLGGKDVYSAYMEALKDSSEDDILFIGGSTFVVADLLANKGTEDK